MRSRPGSAVGGTEKMEYIENPYRVKDYQMITKHLREKVHLEKLQSRRTRKGRIGSGTSLQNRGLHNYPMQYNRDDIRSAKWSPDCRRERNARVTVSKGDSTSLKQHSKDMFDFAVKTAPPKNDKTAGLSVSAIRDGMELRRSRASSVNSDISEAPSRTGPTKDGSALYNNKARVLNSIRVRPHTDTGCRYNHERASSKQNIRDAMSQKSSMYDVLELNNRRRIGSSSSCASSGYLLIPRSQESVYSDMHEGDNHYRPNTVEDFLADPEVFDTSYDGQPSNEGSVNDWSGSDQRDQRERRPSGGDRKTHQDHNYLLPPSTPCNVNLVTLDEESSSSDSEPEETPPEPPKVEHPPPSPIKKGGKTLPEPEVVEEPPSPPKLILKGPHCWVDDATVTSSHPDSEDIENAENELSHQVETDTKHEYKHDTKHDPKHDNKHDVKHDTKHTKGLVTATVLPGATPGKTVAETKPQVLDTPPGVTSEIVKDAQDCLIVVNGVDHVEESSTDNFEDSLPPFLCPSSERKSREAAIKDWLCSSNNIFVYPRSLPMV